MGFIPWSPLGGGLLGGALKRDGGGRRADAPFAEQVNKKRERLERFEELCRRIGHPPGDVAIAWLLHNPLVTAPIIGPRSIEQLDSAIRAAAIELDQETLAALDKIFPGPGGEAPSAYSW
jgi:aryl-alcohol dehydrogenase-like predicted oxidoreductase